MRSSKSIPSKYTRNYRSISQRQMTKYNDDLDAEEKEIERLRSILQNSQEHLRNNNSNNKNSKDDDFDNDDLRNNNETKRKRKKKTLPNVVEEDKETKDDNKKKTLATSSVLSNEMEKEMNNNDYYSRDTEENPLIMPSSKKKKKQQQQERQHVELTAEEIRQAKQLQKKTERKLKQLTDQAEKKRKRKDLYEKLKKTAISKQEIQLLSSSSKLGKKRRISKKEQLKQLLHKEKAGLELNEEERSILYRERKLEPSSSSTTIGETNYQESLPTGKRIEQRENQDEKTEKLQLNKKKKLGRVHPSLHQKDEKADDGLRSSAISSAISEDIDDITRTSSIDKTKKRARTSSGKKDFSHGTVTSNINHNDDDDDSDDDDEHNDEDNTDDTSSSVVTDKETTKRQNDDSRKEKKDTATVAPTTTKKSAASFAAQMLASIANLTSTTAVVANSNKQKDGEDENTENEYDNDDDDEEEEDDNDDNNYNDDDESDSDDDDDNNDESNSQQTTTEQQPQKKKKTYVITNPTVLKIAAPCRQEENNSRGAQRGNIAITVPRPESIQQMRYELPVAEMEFEVMDAIRNNDITIICGETGSGKSTQIPQYLYEAGFSLGKDDELLQQRGQHAEGETKSSNSNASKPYLIGVTQPRRVAAISTAKRVCYEMGQGDGQTIQSSSSSLTMTTATTTTTNNNNNQKKKKAKRGEGNLVAYQTRYETAGLGDNTRVKFMTDGILLQEIQSDLLLRKYSVIVLDEAHERNLNTDVLIGLLSASISLRRKAVAEEEEEAAKKNNKTTTGRHNLLPLKLVIMSATLRVEDFTNNERLFTDGAGLVKPPVVVKIPGRTFPVTIHHSKVTELDDYEEVAFQKVCKIHRKLPQGGILIFLTGKQEILRMVNRLKRTLVRRRTASTHGTKDDTFSRKENTAEDVSASTVDINAVHNPKSDDSLTPIPRDMDDDEADGDIFQHGNYDEDNDDYDNYADDDNEDDEPTSKLSSSLSTTSADNEEEERDDNIPKNVVVLPLYSMLSIDEQAKVFAPVPDEDHRLIVVATNIAETSITIPGISYVVDTGRQKSRKFDSGGVNTGIASYEVTWVCKAAANQRAGRAGRTGPGHCYRLYSSSMFSRHMEEFAMPEVLTKPLEDVVLAMKAMKISNISRFPFPTPPSSGQIDAAVKLLANIGCLDISNNTVTDDNKNNGNDGEITLLGTGVATLPLGARYGKMLLLAAHAGVLDYAIAMVAALSEISPFRRGGDQEQHDNNESEEDEENSEGGNHESSSGTTNTKKKKKKKKKREWAHRGGDILATVIAVGAYTYAGRGAGGVSEKAACRKFCEEHDLNPVVMERIQKIRRHLARLCKARMRSSSDTVFGDNSGNIMAMKMGGFISSMPPPNKLQERILMQVIAAGLLDHVAMLAPLGSFPGGGHSSSLRSAYASSVSHVKEPLFMDRNSVLYSRDSRLLPKWVCYDAVIRKTLKDGNTIVIMKNVTPIDVTSLAMVAKKSRLLRLGGPLPSPQPIYDSGRDEVMCCVSTKFGDHGWEIPPLREGMTHAIRKHSSSNQYKHRSNNAVLVDDPFHWFARFLLEGKVIVELQELQDMLNDSPSIITRRKPISKVALFVSALSSAGIDSSSALQKYWAERDDKFLIKIVKSWVRPDRLSDAKQLWINTVKKRVKLWQRGERS